ncbi:MAG: hypothetical protein FGM15_12660 [Chthoniobacterales bacterium]|nr:hypothetical protein [Chthoniobacterales bacterium]
MAILDSYPIKLRRLLEGVPDGMPRHDWINKVAFYGARFRSPERLEETLLRIAERMGWHKTRDFTAEIRRAVRDAHRAVGAGPVPEREKLPDWPLPNRAARAERQALEPFEPVRLGVGAWDAWQMIFRGGAWVCAGANEFQAETRQLEEWEDFAANMQFVVPNAMRAAEGRMPEGRMSPRCRGNACRRRRWLVVECDLGTDLDEQCRVLSSLDHVRCPLRLAVFSGGKSVHGWFDAAGLSDAEQLRWYRHAVYLGHDPKLWLKWQWVRAPGGRREDGRKQEIYYFKP